MQTPPTDIFNAVVEVQMIVSSGNQTETNLQRVIMQLKSIADFIEMNKDVTVNETVSWQTLSSYDIFYMST